MRMVLDTGSIDSYQTFLKVKALPQYRFEGTTAVFPDEYAAHIGAGAPEADAVSFKPSKWCFDYQAAIARTAVTKRKYAVFADCGLGKTAIITEFARHVSKSTGGRVLIVSPLMVTGQTCDEAERWYRSKLPITRIRAAELPEWLENGKGIAITNYEAIVDGLPQNRLAGLILDESSMLKSHYGAWGTRLIELGKGVAYKLCATGTPAPNDRIEFANHAVFLDAFPTVNSFLARFFVNRGETSERWELKPHALKPFYVALSHWCIFLTNPAVYGWKDGARELPPIHVHRHHVPLSTDQRQAFQAESNALFLTEAGGIGSRGRIARIGKGFVNGEKVEAHKTEYIKSLVASWPDESTIIWCKYNQEQDEIAAAFPDCANIDGTTPMEERERLVADFKAGRRRVMVTKPKILGFGVNLQICTRQVFSTLQDSYEEFYQAVKRSNRYGSTKPLNVHIPLTELEAPMVDTVMKKANRVALDAAEQERIFLEMTTLTGE